MQIPSPLSSGCPIARSVASESAPTTSAREMLIPSELMSPAGSFSVVTVTQRLLEAIEREERAVLFTVIEGEPHGAHMLVVEGGERVGDGLPDEVAGQADQLIREEHARIVRAILWRLTMLKLREGNPAFLAANGFGD